METLEKNDTGGAPETLCKAVVRACKEVYSDIDRDGDRAISDLRPMLRGFAAGFDATLRKPAVKLLMTPIVAGAAAWRHHSEKGTRPE